MANQEKIPANLVDALESVVNGVVIKSDPMDKRCPFCGSRDFERYSKVFHKDGCKGVELLNRLKEG